MIDHIAGSRRGQRDELAPVGRLRFGRHPDNDIIFDAHRDLDASSRHAELRCDDGRFALVDVGSSNGTFVDGERVREVDLSVGVAAEVEFGSGGPRLRLFIGDDDQVSALPSLETSASAQAAASRTRTLVWALGLAVVASLIALGWWRLAG